MSTANEIAAERFAKGEISKEEYDTIVSSLDNYRASPQREKVTAEEHVNLEKIANVLCTAGAGGGIAIFLFLSKNENGLSSFGLMMAFISAGLLALGLYMKFGLNHHGK